MKRLTIQELKEAPDYEELKWYQAMPIVVAAFGETWKRLAGEHDYDTEYFVVIDEDEKDAFFGTYADDEPIESSD